MAIWNGLPDWLGNRGSKTALDELNIRRHQAVEAAVRKAEQEASKAEYINQLQNQWNQPAINAIDQSIYNGLTNISTSYDPWAGLANTQYTQTGIPVTTTGVGTGLGNVYNHPVYYQQLPSTVVSSTGSYAVYPYPTPSVTPQNPQIGDKLVMEYDGKDWITRYEAASDPKIMPKPKGVEFSLDELEEASKIIEDLQHEAA